MPFWRSGWLLSQIQPRATTISPFSKAVRHNSHKALSITLRPYQETCLEACLETLRSGVSRIGVSLPTGSGKTAVFISLLSRILPSDERPEATRALVIVNSIELAQQAAAQAERLHPDWKVEIEQGVKHKASGLADVTIATYQTLLQPLRLAKFSPKYLKAVVVDEAHHAAAPSYRRILAYFDPTIPSPEVLSTTPSEAVPGTIPIIGFSATFSRHDGLALGSVFKRIVYHRDFLEMIKEQWLCNVRFTTVRANINLKAVTVSSRTGDFNPTSLAQVINTDTVNRLVVQSWLDRAAPERKSTLVFCVNLAHVGQLTQAFRSAGIDARYVHSGTPMAERGALIEGFKAGVYPVLLNCAILTEGTDIPNIDCVIVARPTRSRNIGRGMRLSPATEKVDCHIIDFVDITTRIPGVVCTPTLFGLDPSEVVDNMTTDDLEKRADAQIALDGTQLSMDTADDIPDPTTVTYIDFENPFSLVNEASGVPPHVAQLSRNSWVGCGDDIYVLECLGKGHVRIEPVDVTDEDDFITNPDLKRYFRAHFSPVMFFGATKHTKAPFFRMSKEIMKAESLDIAIRGCDTYIANQILRGQAALGVLRSARWRMQPASEYQKAVISKRWRVRTSVPDDADDRGREALDKLNRMTKGEAANIITRLKHGAQSRYAQKIKNAQKAERVATKERMRLAREHVRVGPLPQHPTSADTGFTM
ncbi:hypothetical protein HETIRDRAFT_456722 [Heterobasidion irregulare TC 32-1]|uniref:P-loop containing nucleoside triphosphate hydrolase protein n=1 Tax=Heterobasidion irregulare (strain TC 32-1) TaxID=747525 RepID=W4KNC2_HETIT|nr:uncharacterized protein HETIRDRAFT_456722 [Heterobasidion irregulare TC 32-1]ETW86880.1 hypothetical protein HETIRDRAFT_456722 [Heterobasidion irregulare TC 32-1]